MHSAVSAAARWTPLPAAGALLLCSCALLPPAPPPNDHIGSYPGRPRPATAPAPSTTAAATRPAAGPLTVSLDEAILMALERNQGLSVQRIDPSIFREIEQQERAAFDLDAIVEAASARRREPGTDPPVVIWTDKTVDAALSQRLPTGTDYSVGITGSRLTSNLRNDRYVTRVGLTVNQALLRGAGLNVNLATIRQAAIDTRISEYELRRFAEVLLADVESTYWDYALAQRTIEIVTNAMTLAEQQVVETRERINVGKLPETELAAAAAELARRRENLINARSRLATTRLRLLRLLNPADEDFWGRQVVLTSVPSRPAADLDDVETYVQVALRMRPELNQARLAVRREDLELVRTRNGLLPRMDAFIEFGMTGYSDSFGTSLRNIARDKYDVLVGVALQYPPANRAAEARHQREVFTRQRAVRAVDNLAQLVQVDVRSAYIEVARAQEQVAATAATRRFQEETLRAETEKFRVGKSVSFLVAQAQRDLLDSQISEVRAVVAYLQALINLHLQSGALLQRRGIAAPGAAAVDPSAPPRR